jgi:hypothetical protein
MKKHFLTLFIIFLALPVIHANVVYFNITQENSVQEIRTGLQALIDNAIADDIIIVTGSKTNANDALMLNIRQEITVVWQANYQSGAAFGATHLLSFTGGGTFEVADGKLITENATAIIASGANSTIIISGNGIVQTSGNGEHAIWANGNIEIKDNAQISGDKAEVIFSEGNNAVIMVNGGTVTATPTAENAICTMGRNSKIFVTGGYVSNDANVNAPTIVAHDPRPDSEALVHVSGNAKVEAKGEGCAIISRSVKVSDNAQVNSNLGGDFFPTATVRGDYSVEVSDNAKISASNNYAIFGLKITVSGNSVIEAKEDAIAIYLYGGQSSFGNLQVKGQAQVIAANNYAVSIFDNMVYYSCTIAGGMAFAYGNKISDVINDSNFTLPFYSGVILAWNKAAGNTNYEMYSTDDILIEPETATAYWMKSGTETGIFYADGENTGFIPLEVNVLSINEPVSSNINFYPNPTTGELRIEMSDMRHEISDIEVFDIYGRKQSHASRVTCHESKVDISHLQAGIYFVKVGDRVGKVVKQ